MVEKKTGKAATKETTFTVDVRKPKEIDGKPNCYRFTLIVNGVTLYGMKSIAYKDEETGETRSFIAFPGYKGNDDKFYNNAWFPVSAELQAEIEKQIGEKLP